MKRTELIDAIAAEIAENGTLAGEGWELTSSNTVDDAVAALEALEKLGFDTAEFLSRQSA